MDQHYVCSGGCGGTLQEPGVCQTPTCPHNGQQMEPCDCADGAHYGRGKKEEQTPAPENGQTEPFGGAPAQ